MGVLRRDGDNAQVLMWEIKVATTFKPLKYRNVHKVGPV